MFSASPRIAIVGTASCDPVSFQTLFNDERGLLQGRCLHLVLSCHPGVRHHSVSLIAPKAIKYIWASLIIPVLFTVIVSYVVIALNVKRKAPPYPSGALSSERKLTVTLLIVIVLSTVTFFPFFFILSLM